MKNPNTGQQRHGRRGITLVIVVVMLPVLFGFAALTIDLGRGFNTRASLQSAADAAAMAASQDLGGLDPYLSISTARSTAAEYIGRYMVWGDDGISEYEISFGESTM